MQELNKDNAHNVITYNIKSLIDTYILHNSTFVSSVVLLMESHV